MRPIWSPQPPTVPGWYVVRDKARMRMVLRKYEQGTIDLLRLIDDIPFALREWSGPLLWPLSFPDGR